MTIKGALLFIVFHRQKRVSPSISFVLFHVKLQFPCNFQTALLPFVFLPSPNVSRRAVIVFAGSFPCIIIVLLICYANCVINSGERRIEGGKKKKNTEINKQVKRWALPPGLLFDIRDASWLQILLQVCLICPRQASWCAWCAGAKLVSLTSHHRTYKYSASNCTVHPANWTPVVWSNNNHHHRVHV